MNQKRRWTENEIYFIKENYLKLSYSEIGKMLKRSDASISLQCNRLNLIKEKSWTNEELEFLKSNYKNYNYTQLALKFNCNKKVIQYKARLLGLSKNRNWDTKEIQFIKDNYPIQGSIYCSKMLGINNELISSKAANLGIKKLRGEIYLGYILCSTCKLIKPKNLFYPNKNTSFKRRSRCKTCDNKAILIKRKIDIKTNILHKLRSRLRVVIKKNSKCASTQKLLGCSLDFFINYFKSKMTPDMTWADFMSGKIHIDHIRPCSSFNLIKPEEQQKCFHYTNLQPLWAQDNLAKGDKILV